MQTNFRILTGILTALAFCQLRAGDTITFKGLLTAYTHLNSENKLHLWGGIRFIPQINYEHKLTTNSLIDIEASANILGNAGSLPFDTLSLDGNVKPYRLWARYSSAQFEFRAGLQKINFGSATMLRPLMWFDQMDPRDPLRLTDGVWGALARYYFLNNANIWLWGLYGNNQLKGWEPLKTRKNSPEFGGRFQHPLPAGEAAVTYHHRTAIYRMPADTNFRQAYSPENRIGFDFKLDIVVGCWLEATWSNVSKKAGIYTNQHILNAGADYTFGCGNGLNIVFEQLLFSFSEKPFSFESTGTFSLLNLGYPLGIFDNINAIVYFDWKSHKTYNFINWQHQFKSKTLYLMGYFNPKEYYLPAQSDNGVLYAGTGIQAMLVINY
ncbi:MAG: hypothetical protein JXB34_03910 [Bacteroidales bacterium]|nr:hypothetical protein [Bacteroidales bacterium]